MQLNKICFKIDKPNAYAMIHGFRKEGKLYRQSIWLTNAGSRADFPKLLTLQKNTQFKLSPIGKEIDAKNFTIPHKYIAKLDSEYFIRNDKALWEKVCSNGLFDIWDPKAPYKRFAQSKRDPDNFRIQLLRICEIDHEFSKDDIKSSNPRNAPQLIPPIPEVEIGTPVISDEEFVNLKDILERSVAPYLTRPPQHAVSASPKVPLTINAITNKDIELLESEEDEFPEGRLLTRSHKLRERSPQAIKKKKNNRNRV